MSKVVTYLGKVDDAKFETLRKKHDPPVSRYKLAQKFIKEGIENHEEKK